jgi:hypothetical protein
MMAERSKALDLGSSLRAWVQTPLMSNSLFAFLAFIFIQDLIINNKVSVKVWVWNETAIVFFFANENVCGRVLVCVACAHFKLKSLSEGLHCCYVYVDSVGLMPIVLV